MSECNINKQEVVEELNDLLKGTYLGRFSFQNLINRTSNKEVNDLLAEMVDTMSTHVKMVTDQVIECDGIPHDDHTLAISMTDMMTAMKNNSYTTKEKILEECIKEIAMGQSEVTKMIAKYGDKPVCLNKIINKMNNDYKSMICDIEVIL